jgi:hypothetical protein
MCTRRIVLAIHYDYNSLSSVLITAQDDGSLGERTSLRESNVHVSVLKSYGEHRDGALFRIEAFSRL